MDVFLALGVVLSFCLAGVSVATHTACDDGWVADDGYCYWFADDPVHFTEAEHYCEQKGSTIVQVYSAMENAFVKDQLRKRVSKAVCHWMGMTDELAEGVWRYNTGSNNVATYTDWHPSQPGRDGEEDCAIFWQSFDYQWGDLPCTNDCVPICKRRGYGEVTEIVG